MAHGPMAIYVFMALHWSNLIGQYHMWMFGPAMEQSGWTISGIIISNIHFVKYDIHDKSKAL